jgi:hypothetical protein
MAFSEELPMKRERGDHVSLPHAGHSGGPISKHISQSTHSASRCSGMWRRGMVSWARDRMTSCGSQGGCQGKFQ